jgi:murein DD-endopeptidase MepM/ murein hydrolase activator NlpD
LFALLFSGCGLVGYGANKYSSGRSVYHTVAAGDTLWRIGNRYGVESDTIALLNGIYDADRLRVGQRLFVGYRLRSGEITPTLQTASVRTPSTGRVPYTGGKLAWPVAGGRLVSVFGPRGGSFHDGLDIAAPTGTAVFAAHDGQIIYSGNRLSGYGNLLILRGTDGLTTVYAHNDRLRVSPGARVRRGQRIADVGNTGRSSGPHLHFEVRTRDVRGRYIAVDPIPFLKKDNEENPRYRVNNNLTPILARLWK